MHSHLTNGYSKTNPHLHRQGSLRAVLNTAHHEGNLRAADCRIALDLAAAGVNPDNVILYVKLMIHAVSKKRQPKEPK